MTELKLKVKFNRQNLRLFADNLYEKDSNGDEHYMPMCDGTLAKANGEIQHCILGELHEHFTGKPVARRATKRELSLVQGAVAVGDGVIDVNDKTVIFTNEDKIVNNLLDGAAIRKRVEVSKKHKQLYHYERRKYYDKEDAYKILHSRVRCNLPEINDRESTLSGADVFVQRAKDLQEELYRIADTFLR